MFFLNNVFFLFVVSWGDVALRHNFFCMKTDLFDRLVLIVGRCCEVERNGLLGGRSQPCVDARSMLVRGMVELGFKECEVASLCGLTRQCVNKLKNGFDVRMRDWWFRRRWADVSNEIAMIRQ